MGLNIMMTDVPLEQKFHALRTLFFTAPLGVKPPLLTNADKLMCIKYQEDAVIQDALTDWCHMLSS